MGVKDYYTLSYMMHCIIISRLPLDLRRSPR